MSDPGRVAMLFLDVFVVLTTLWLFWRRGAAGSGVAVGAAASFGWLTALHWLSTSGVVPAQVGAVVFLGAVVVAVAVVGALLGGVRVVREAVQRLSDADLLMLQGPRVLFGATFFLQGLTGGLPRTFGLIDGATHLLAGALGLAAAASLRRDATSRALPWAANLFGLVDIVVVLSSLSVVLLPDITTHHPMMYAVFLPAAFWACWHAVSLHRLTRVQLPKLRSAGALVVLGLALTGSGCRPFILRTVMTTVEPYFHGPDVDRVALTQLTGHVFTFQWNWYRNLVVLTDEGLVVIDPMGVQAATALKQALDERFPGVPVRRVIYSHYHLDHVRGAKVLEPLEVVAHENCGRYWKPLDLTDVVLPTRTIAGDTDLTLGGVELRALDVGLSHTDTLFAFHLPAERVLFTADLGLVKTVAPTGVPDRYAPGYLAALDRLAALDFDLFVPSHFGHGRKQDLIEWRDMLEYGRQLAREAIAKRGTFEVETSQLGAYFDAIYFPMRARYGDWHGFDEMVILNIVRDIEGEGLGH